MHHRIYITLQTVDVCISKLGSTESYLYMYMQFYYELTMVFTVKDSYFMCRYTIYYLYTHIYIQMYRIHTDSIHMLASTVYVCECSIARRHKDLNTKHSQNLLGSQWCIDSGIKVECWITEYHELHPYVIHRTLYTK